MGHQIHNLLKLLLFQFQFRSHANHFVNFALFSLFFSFSQFLYDSSCFLPSVLLVAITISFESGNLSDFIFFFRGSIRLTFLLARFFKFELNPRLAPWSLQYAKKQSEKIIMDRRTEGARTDPPYSFELALNS